MENDKNYKKPLSEFSFWATCPDCKRKFGIPVLIVCKFLDRVLAQMGNRMNKSVENWRERDNQKRVKGDKSCYF